MTPLYDDEFYPITSGVYFINEKVETLCDWSRQILVGLAPRWSGAAWGQATESEAVLLELNGSLRELIQKGLDRVLWRYTWFVRTESDWTAVISWGNGGPSPLGPIQVRHHPEELFLRCRTSYYSLNHTRSGSFGSRVFSYEGGITPTDQPQHTRSVGVLQDIGGWEFEESGEPFEFENIERYRRRPVSERMTMGLVHEYAMHFGVRFLDPDFYGPKGYLIGLAGERRVPALASWLRPAATTDAFGEPISEQRRREGLERAIRRHYYVPASYVMDDPGICQGSCRVC